MEELFTENLRPIAATLLLLEDWSSRTGAR